MKYDQAAWVHRMQGLLRLVTGLLFMQHGVQKLFGLLGGMGGSGATADFGSIYWVAGVMETFGGALIVLGLLTRPVAFLVAGEMAYAYFTRHLPDNPWPILNNGELAALYCFIFLFFFAAGAGAWSIDALIRRRRFPEPVPASRSEDTPDKRYKRFETS